MSQKEKNRSGMDSFEMIESSIMSEKAQGLNESSPSENRDFQVVGLEQSMNNSSLGHKLLSEQEILKAELNSKSQSPQKDSQKQSASRPDPSPSSISQNFSSFLEFDDVDSSLLNKIKDELNNSYSSFISTETLPSAMDFKTKKSLFLAIPDFIIFKSFASAKKNQKKNPYFLLMKNNLINSALKSMKSQKGFVSQELFPRILLVALYRGKLTINQLGLYLDKVLNDVKADLKNPILFDEKLLALKESFCFDQEKLNPLKNYLILKFCMFFYMGKISAKELKQIFKQIFEDNDLCFLMNEIFQLNEEEQLKDFQEESTALGQNLNDSLSKFNLEKLKKIPFYGQYIVQEDKLLSFYLVCSQKNIQNFNFDQFLDFKLPFSSIGLPHYLLSSQQISRLCHSYKNIRYLNLWNTKIRQLEGTSIQILTNLEYLNLSSNFLTISDVHFMQKHQWPFITQLKLGFIDGSLSWIFLADIIRNIFPAVYELFFELNEQVRAETIKQYILMRRIGINAYFHFSKKFLNSLDSILNDIELIDLTFEFNTTEQFRILRKLRLKKEHRSFQSAQDDSAEFVELVMNQSLISQQNSRLRQEYSIQQSNQEFGVMSISPLSQSHYSELNDGQESTQNPKYITESDPVSKPVTLSPTQSKQDLAEEKEKEVELFFQKQLESLIFHSLTLQEKTKIVMTLINGIYEIETLKSHYKLETILSSLSQNLFPSLFMIPIGSIGSNPKLLQKILLALTWKPNQQILVSKKSKSHFQSFINALIHYKDSQTIEQKIIEFSPCFNFDGALSSSDNDTLLRLWVDLLRKTIRIDNVRKILTQLQDKKIHESFDQFFSFILEPKKAEQIQEADNKQLAEIFKNQGENAKIEKQNKQPIKKTIRQNLRDLQKTQYGAFFFLKKDKIMFSGLNQGSVEEDIDIEELVKTSHEHIHGLTIPRVKLDIPKMNLLFTKWSNLKVLNILTCSITSLEGSGLQHMQQLQLISINDNFLNKQSVLYLQKHSWPKMKFVRATFIDGSQSWDLLIASINKIFPALQILNFRENPHVNSKTYEKLFALSNYGIIILLRIHKSMINTINQVEEQAYKLKS